MEKIIGWCEHHKNDEEPADDGPKYDGINEVDEWDTKHLAMPDSPLFELIIVSCPN
jgi:S-phase kinase-associated protein 1